MPTAGQYSKAKAKTPSYGTATPEQAGSHATGSSAWHTCPALTTRSVLNPPLGNGPTWLEIGCQSRGFWELQFRQCRRTR